MSLLTFQFQAAQKAKKSIGLLSDIKRQNLIRHLADALWKYRTRILSANQKDADVLEVNNPKRDRLLLNESRLQNIVDQTRMVADLLDPVGQIFVKKTLKNGLHLQKITVPLGVIGMIYESRPNVTVDAVALGLRSGNVMLLKGSREAIYSNEALVQIIQEILEQEGLFKECVQLLPSDRDTVREILTAVQYVDLVIPRGSKNLIDFVREHARVPVIETGAGVCHTYVHASADIEKALLIVENAKTQRPSVCNALDTLLVDMSIAENFLPLIAEKFLSHHVEIFADEVSYEIFKKEKYPFFQKASPEDFGREYLDLKCSVKVVENMDQALAHIEKYSSKHSEAIVAEDKNICQKFLQEVDAAVVYSNASTYFSDGGWFGLGAEMGISTQKLHARGPFALEKLVCEKWIVEGEGQIRTS